MSNIDKVLIGARFPKKDANLIREICRRRREGISDFVRRAILKELAQLNFLNTEEVKALGLDVNIGGGGR